MEDNRYRATLQTLSSRNGRVTQAALTSLKKLLPSLDTDAILSPVSETITDWCTLLAAETFNREQALKIGASIPYIDALQPIDIITLQSAMLDALLEDTPEMPAFAITRIHEALSALLAGMFAAKSQRAASIDVAAVSRISHDLKNPINSINGFSWVILKGIDGPITEYQREDLTSIHEAGKKLLDMINDTFAGLKQKAKQTYIHDETFHVWSFLSDVLHALEPGMIDGNQWLQLVFAGDPGSMKADASILRIVLLSLLSYYARTVPESTISLVVMRQKIDADDWLVFRVEHRTQGDLLADTQGEWGMGLPNKPLPGSDDDDTTRQKWVNTDPALTAAYRLGPELGAELTMDGMSEDAPCKAFTLWVPAGINQTDVF